MNLIANLIYLTEYSREEFGKFGIILTSKSAEIRQFSYEIRDFSELKMLFWMFVSIVTLRPYSVKTSI